MTFLRKNWKRFDNESHCYEYCSKVARNHYDKANYSKAAVYLENAKRSLIQLEQMKKVQQDSTLAKDDKLSRFQTIKIYVGAACTIGFLLYGLITSGGRTW